MPATPNGAEFRVNTVTQGDQITYAPLAEDRMVRAVATDAAGNFVVVWSSQGEDDPEENTGYGVYAQLYTYDENGVLKVTPPISVNAAHTTSRNQYAASVAMDADGDFVVTWSSNDYGQSGDSDQFGVFAQRYDEAGVAQGTTITVNETTAGSQQHSSITTLENGDFIITWTGAKSGEGTNIYARRFSGTTGAPLGGEIPVNTTTAGDQLSSSVAVDPVGGRFVVVWESADQDGSGLNVYAQLFNADGSKLGSEFRVNTFTASSQKNASVAIDQNGNFVITWSSNGVDGKDGSDWGVYARRFAIDDSAATKRIEKDAADVLVNKTTFQAQQYSSVAMDATGNYVISWTGVDDGAGQNDVYYKRYYANGVGVDGDSEFQVNNTVTANNQELSTVAVDGNGNFVIAWTSELQDGSGAGVYAQRYNSIVPGNNLPTDIGLTANTVNENAATNTVIGELSTVDQDTTDTHTYTLVSGSDIFKIVEVSGKYQLQVKDGSLLDFETEPTVTVQIKTDDGKGGIFTKPIDITVNNVNERPTDISLTNTQIAENSPIGTLVDIISGTDPENSSTLTFELAVGVPDNAKFAIVKNGSNYELRTNGVFDYENDADREHTIRIVAKDPDGLTYEEDILITVNNANDAPTDLALDNSIVFEGTIEVGNFTTTDSDAGDTHQYTLIAGGLNNNLFDIVGGKLRFKTSPTKGDYQIKVRTTDQNGTGQSYDADFTVKVKDVNAAPTDLNLSNSQVGEGVIAVGAFTTTDPDNPDDVHKYSFVNELGLNNDLFEIIGGNQLRFKAAPTPGSYKIKVRTTDLNGTGFSYAEEFTITVDDVNDAPTDITLSNSSVNERVQNVGSFSTTDPDAGDTHLYSFVDEAGLNNDLFEFVDGNKLHFKAAPAPGSYTVKVRTTDLNGTGLSYDESFTITVNNANDAPTAITLSPDANVNEREQDVGSFSTTDPDAAEAGQHIYTLADGGTDNALFTIVNGNTLRFLNPPAPGEYQIKVRTTDPTNLFHDQTFTITVGNLNDAPTAITLSPDATVDERVQEVGTFSTTDPDTGDTHSYSLVNGGLNNNLFEIVEGNKLKFIAPPAPGEYQIKVRTTDAGGLTHDQTFIITVGNLNDAPTAITLSPDATVDERVQEVGTFSTTDPDTGDTHSYSLVDGGLNNNLFEIVEGNKLKFIAPPAPGEYQIKVRTTDAGGLTHDQTFTITVGNLNDAPTAITLSPDATVDERVQEVGTFSTTDPDTGDTHSYSLVNGGLNNNLFEIVEGNKLKFIAPPAPGEYQIKVRTTDAGGLTHDQTFTITVSDTNDRPIALKLVDDLNVDVNLINENVTDLKVGTLKTTDPDAIDNHTYSFIGGLPDNNAFTLSGDKLFFKNSPNYETQDEYTIKVRTTDKGGLTFDQVFVIKIKDINEAPVVSPADGTITYAEGSTAVPIAADLQVSDPDQSKLTEATVTLNNYIAGQDELRFTNQNGITGTFNEATKTLKLAGLASVDAYRTALRSIAYINTSGSPNTTDRTIQISVKDEGGLSSNLATRTLQITSINGAPVVTTSSAALTYNENAGALAIDPGITVSDQDSSFLMEATIEIVGYVANQDQLTFNSIGLGINSVFDTAKGILRLSGKASIANYQTALSAVAYTHSSDNPGNTTRTIQFTVKDDGTPGLASPVATRTIQLLPANDAPVVTSSGTLSYTENAGAVAINPSLSVGDADSANLTGATIVLTGYVANQDQLGFTNQNGITGKLSQAGSTLTLALSGNASVSQYQQALRSITYTNSSEIPNPANRTVSMTVTDGTATSNVGTRTIEVRSINDPPVVTTSVSSVVFPKTDGAIAIDPGLELKDADSAQLIEATIVLTGYIAGEDRLLFTDQNGITGSFNGATGVLKLEGSASVTDYQAALRSVIYTNTSNTPKNAPRTVEINATDGIDRSNTVKVEIRFDKDTSLPVLDLNGGGGGLDFSSTFVIKGSAVSIVASEASLTDPDSKTLTSARVSIANLLDGQNEELLVDTQGTGITAFYNREQGTLSLQGTASITTYLNVLRSIKYQNHAINPDRTTRTILFQVSDGVGQSDPAQAIVQITKVNLLTQGTTGQDSLETTPATDLIDAQAGDDTLASILEYLQQNDQIDGGSGNDTFILKAGAGAAVVDVSNSVNQMGGILTGNTTVRNFEYFDFSSFKGSAALTGHDGFDRLTSGAGNDTILGAAGNDYLSGNAGQDYLDGGTGVDTLIGGAGDDTYGVDHLGDQIMEEAGMGYELIISSISWTLGGQLDDLTLKGSAVVGIGNELNNAITGNSIGNSLVGNFGNDILIGLGGKDTLVGGNGRDVLQAGNGNDRLEGGNGNDQLDGGSGKDLLLGGKGKDRFFIARPRKSSLDTLKDFNPVDDTIRVSRQGFSRELKRGKITASQFVLGSRARDQSDRFIYDQSTGALFFDRDGIGGAGQVQFARLSNRATIGRSDIAVIQ